MARRANAKQPRYQEIAGVLRGELAAEVFPVGGPFPKELDLCERFGCSRFTIRNALKELEVAGLVERRKAVGTIVRASTPESAYVQSLASAEEILQYPDETKLLPVERVNVAADPKVARWFGIGAGTPLVRVSGVRIEQIGGRKICWSDIYVPPTYGGIYEHMGGDLRPVYKMIEDVYGERTRKVEVEISVTVIEGDNARRLGVVNGPSGLEILRIYAGTAGRIVEASVSIHPQDRFTYKLAFAYETRGNQV